MHLPGGMYWHVNGKAECMPNIYVVWLLKAVGHCPFVTCACIAEGCGLLADGQTCLQITTRGYAVAARTL